MSTVSLCAGLATGLALELLRCWWTSTRKSLRAAERQADWHLSDQVDHPAESAGYPETYHPTAADLAEYGEWCSTLPTNDLHPTYECAADYGGYCPHCDAEMAAAHDAMRAETESGWYMDMVRRAELGGNGADPDWRAGQ
jgi:hypothetical protein